MTDTLVDDLQRFIEMVPLERIITHTSQLQKRLPIELAFAFRITLAVEAYHRKAAKLELVSMERNC